MLDLKKALEEYSGKKRGAAEYLLQDDGERAQIQQFLNDNGFTDATVIGAGTNAFVMRDNINQNLVIRIAIDFPPEMGGGSERAVIPQTLQDIFTKNFLDEGIPIKLEVLPYATRDINGHELNDLRHGFSEEIKACNLQAFMGKCSDDDFGIFEYTDRSAPKKVLIAIDDSVFNASAGSKPKCTANYPSLAVQQTRHQELWDADSRLQRLLPNGPAKLPETRIVANTERGDRPHGSK